MQSTKYGDRVRLVQSVADGDVFLVQQSSEVKWETVHAYPELGDIYAAAKADAAARHLQQMWKQFPVEQVVRLRAAMHGALA